MIVGKDAKAWNVIKLNTRNFAGVEMKKRLLEQSFNENSLRALYEAEGDEQPNPLDKPPAGEGGTSLDAQVDRYLSEYEGEAKNAKQEGKDFHRLVGRLLSEAGDDEGKSSGEGGTDAGSGEAPKASAEQLDVESFCNSVVRLIDNYDSLLEVRSTLLRRAMNFLGKVYDKDVIDSFERIMREEHGIEAGKSKEDTSAEEFPAPSADRAGDGGTGGAPV